MSENMFAELEEYFLTPEQEEDISGMGTLEEMRSNLEAAMKEALRREDDSGATNQGER